jgi:hypothetical protein
MFLSAFLMVFIFGVQYGVQDYSLFGIDQRSQLRLFSYRVQQWL